VEAQDAEGEESRDEATSQTPLGQAARDGETMTKKLRVTATFRELHEMGACTARYRHLAKALGGITKYGIDKPINLLTILEHNGFSDVDWFLLQSSDVVGESGEFKYAHSKSADMVNQMYDEWVQPISFNPTEAERVAKLRSLLR